MFRLVHQRKHVQCRHAISIVSLNSGTAKNEEGTSAGTQLENGLLKNRAEILLAIFESLPVGVMVADLEGKPLFLNPAAERILNARRSNLSIPERATVYGWYLSDEITLVHSERFPLFRASHGERVSGDLFLCAIGTGRQLVDLNEWRSAQ